MLDLNTVDRLSVAEIEREIARVWSNLEAQGHQYRPMHRRTVEVLSAALARKRAEMKAAAPAPAAAPEAPEPVRAPIPMRAQTPVRPAMRAPAPMRAPMPMRSERTLSLRSAAAR